MLPIILATARPEAVRTFTAALASDQEVQLKLVHSGAEVLAAVSAAPPQLVVVDSDLPDTDALSLVRRLLMLNALVNTAVMSPLAEAEFHEASEGLGVLGRLPVTPGPNDAAHLLRALRRILAPGG